MPAVRVLLAKSFIDSHDRAIRTVGRVLRDAGMEVVLIDYEEPIHVVNVALDEDVNVIGISFMSGGQVAVTQAITDGLRSRGAEIPIVVGGTIRPFDIAPLTAAGVVAVFRGGERLDVIAETFRKLGQGGSLE